MVSEEPSEDVPGDGERPVATGLVEANEQRRRFGRVESTVQSDRVGLHGVEGGVGVFAVQSNVCRPCLSWTRP